MLGICAARKPKLKTSSREGLGPRGLQTRAWFCSAWDVGHLRGAGCSRVTSRATAGTYGAFREITKGCHFSRVNFKCLLCLETPPPG